MSRALRGSRESTIIKYINMLVDVFFFCNTTRTCLGSRCLMILALFFICVFFRRRLGCQPTRRKKPIFFFLSWHLASLVFVSVWCKQLGWVWNGKGDYKTVLLWCGSGCLKETDERRFTMVERRTVRETRKGNTPESNHVDVSGGTKAVDDEAVLL